MGKGSKQSAPIFPVTTQNTGLWGNSVTSMFGTTYNPTDFQKQLVGKAEKYILPTIDYMMNPTTNNPYYQAQKAVRRQAQDDAFENQVISPLAQRNLTRGSAGQGLINSYSNSVARQEAQALADSQAQAGALLSQLMGVYAAPWEMMQGTSSLSQAGANSVANYNMSKYQTDAQLKNSTLNNIGNAIGTIGGAAIKTHTGGLL